MGERKIGTRDEREENSHLVYLRDQTARSIFAGIVKNRSRVEQLCYPPQATNESVNVEGRIDVGPWGVTLLL